MDSAIAVGEIMSGEVLAVAPDAAVADAVRLMSGRNVGSAAVVDVGEELVGILTERDVLRVVAERAAAQQTPVDGCMSRVVVTVTPDTPLESAMRTMAERRIRHLPVLEDGRLVGIVSMRDLVRAKVCPGVPDRARVGLPSAVAVGSA